MADITREYIAEKRQVITKQIHTLQGAIEMLDMIEGELFPLTLDEVAAMVGAESAEIMPKEVTP